MQSLKLMFSTDSLALLGTIALVVLSCAYSEPRLIPRKVLFGNPVRTDPQISPDGTKMAYLAPVKNVLNVWVKTIGATDDQAVTRDTDRGIRHYFWSPDNKRIMYLQDVGGNENWHLYGLDLETDEIKDLTPFDNVQVQLVARDKHFPDELLIAINRENPQLHDVYHVDLTSGELVRAAKNPGNVSTWVADADLKVRGALAATANGGFDLMIWNSDSTSWRKLFTWNSEDAINSNPICFSMDGKYLYLLDSRTANAARLVKLQIATQDTEVLAQDPQYDVTDVMIQPDRYEIQAACFSKDRKEWMILDESIRDDFEAIAKLDHGDFSISSRDDADDKWVIEFTKDDGPTSYYTFDRKTKKGTFLFDTQPDLKSYTLSPMEPMSFKARDGLTIHSYIVFPKGRGRTNLPMVLNVHGGPWHRDYWGYDSEAQWLANRGYVCLEINFRGSTGYGKDFVNASNREWGGRMHDDLVDGVKWAVENRIADPKKIAIYGGSYGGYAALVGATFTPELFCCAVDVVGPSNLLTWITSIPPYWSSSRELLYARVGNPETEPEFLKSRSPLFKVDQIKISVLIAQGANDPRVPKEESEQIVDSLKARGINYQYLLFPDEGHGFVKPENRIKFYAAAEKFLANNLGGRYEETK
ncbi:MAG: S9 family peptidase [Candidatus Zixiibacteriota bacterium]